MLRIVNDSAIKLKVPPHEMFKIAVTTHVGHKDDQQANSLFEEYVRLNVIPDWMVDWCIDVLTNKLVSQG